LEIKPGTISISRLYIPGNGEDEPKISLTVKDKNNFSVHSGDFTINGKVGELIDEKGISLKLMKLMQTRTEFTIPM
jgi:tyrosine-protein kinase Etk/Wzc